MAGKADSAPRDEARSRTSAGVSQVEPTTTEFTAAQYDSNYPDGFEHHWWFTARCRIVGNLVAASAPAKGRLLEVGCGRGMFVQSLRDAGFDCCGVELGNVRPLPSAAQHVRTGLNAVDLPLAERRRYDTIILLDVIEHIPDARSFLRGLADAFPTLSRIIVAVPAREELWSNYDEYYGHYRRYTIATLEQLSRELRWDLSHVTYFFHSVYLPAWFMASVRKTRKTGLNPPRGFLRVLHKLISLGMVMDYYLLPSRLPGTSLIACLSVRR